MAKNEGEPGVTGPTLLGLGITVRVLDARRMRTRAGLFDEFSARLDFPDYFGRNWDALSECLADLSWLGGSAYAIVIAEGECLLAEEPARELTQFVDLIEHVAAEWAEPVALGEAWDRPAVPFHLLLRLDRKESDVARAERLRLGTELKELVVSPG